MRTWCYAIVLFQLLVALFALPKDAFAAPFIVSDADPTGAADKCVYQIGAAPPVETATVVTPPALTGNCRIDTAAFPVGITNMNVWFRSTVYGVDSVQVPFVLGKPGSGGPGPANLRVVQ